MLKLPQRRNPLRVQYLLRARFYPPRLLKNISFWASSRILGALVWVAGGVACPGVDSEKELLIREKKSEGIGIQFVSLKKNGSASRMHPTDVIVGKVQADSSGSGGDDCVELVPLLECCQKRECLAVGRNRSGQIVECRGVFRHNTSGYLGIR